MLSPNHPAPASPAPMQHPAPGSRPNLPGAWISAEVFEPVRAELAEAERFFCTFGLALERCSRRACRTGGACISEAQAGAMHRECPGRPGPHVRH